MSKRLLKPEEQFWRTGRKVGRTVYAVVGLVPSDHDLLIGVMDTKALAAAAVAAHNSQIVKQPATRQPKEHP